MFHQPCTCGWRLWQQWEMEISLSSHAFLNPEQSNYICRRDYLEDNQFHCSILESSSFTWLWLEWHLLNCVSAAVWLLVFTIIWRQRPYDLVTTMYHLPWWAVAIMVLWLHSGRDWSRFPWEEGTVREKFPPYRVDKGWVNMAKLIPGLWLPMYSFWNKIPHSFDKSVIVLVNKIFFAKLVSRYGI